MFDTVSPVQENNVQAAEKQQEFLSYCDAENEHMLATSIHDFWKCLIVSICKLEPYKE